MALQMDIRLKRANKVYREGENVDGVIRLECPTEFRHDSIMLTMDGQVNLTLSAKNVGVFDAFYNSVKPVQLTQAVVEISTGSKMPAGVTEIPFEIPLVARPNRAIYESYHGVFVTIQYKLKCELKRSFLSKDLIKETEFVVEYKKGNITDPVLLSKMLDSSVKFTMTPTSCRAVTRADAPVLPFTVHGVIDHSICDIASPFTGELSIHRRNATVKSIELQLVRVETCGCAEGFSRESMYTFFRRDTEIQNIQIAEGDVPNDVKIPIFMIFPRLFACPTLITTNFKIEFEVNLVIIFQDKHLITENFPIILVRK